MDSLHPIDPENKLNQDLVSLQAVVPKLPSDELERDFAEVSMDILFLEAQITADLGSYFPKELEKANGKIACVKQRAEILKIELSRRISEAPDSI
jgi:hypothetical protein